MRSPAFQFYAADYLADENVALMTLEEEGAYIRALAYCWREGSIPSDLEKLSRLLKGASNQTLTNLQKCFAVSSQDPSRLVHLRLESEREKQKVWREKSAQAGRKSGKVRKLKKIHTEPTLNQPSTLVEPNTNSSFTSSSSSLFEISKATPLLTVRAEDFPEAWNRECGRLPKVETFTDGRRKKVIARVRSGLTIERFSLAVENCTKKPFLSGDNERGWTATFDWLIANAENVEKAITNPYGENKNNHLHPPDPLAGRKFVQAVGK
jgi:uncharacterized protein YdaU (DUF1376 family)